MEAKHANEFRPNEVMWEKTSKGLLRNPDRPLKNTYKRMIYIYGNMFFAKKKTLPLASERRSKVRITPVIRRVSRQSELPEPRLIPEPPVQIPESPLQILESPVQIPESSVQIPESPVQIPESPMQIPESPVQISEPPVQTSVSPEPVQIPEPPVQIPEPPVQPTDAASLDQLMSFVFGEEAQEFQLLHMVPSIFYGDLTSVLDEFERELAMEPMDWTMPRLNPCNGGTKLVGPVWTSPYYRIWKSWSVAGLSQALRAKVSLHHPFLTQVWRARSSFVWKNSHCQFYVEEEVKAELSHVPKKNWVAYLLTVLPLELSNMLARVPTERANNYDFAKDLILKSCQVTYSQFGLAIHQNDHQARRRFVEWAQNEIAVVPDFHKRILFSDEAHFWLNGYVNKQNCRIWSEANPQVYVETPLHPEKLTVWCALWAGGILLQKR
ncbi:hypothetical protein TNCV_443211 [Trichonephila clavipes]|nr:hypothetical protein TNCV_443211 [Trichonephila clavipes]